MLLAAWVFWVVVSITLHELAHGYVAIRVGDDTPYHTGHMTFNPLVHIPSRAWLMFALFGFTWGLMPVNPARMRGRYAEAWVAFAGPACNAIQFVILAVLDVAWAKLAAGHVDDHVLQNTHTLLWVGCMINMMGVCFNLIPIPPLDGSRIVGDIFPKFNNLWHSEHGAVIGLAAFALLFFVGARWIWGIAMVAANEVLGRGADLVGAHLPHPF
jgi:Zn-dependent protease